MAKDRTIEDTDVSDLVPVTLIWDAALGSPADPDLQDRGGDVVSVPPSRIPLPARGTLFGLRGYSRQGNFGAWEWVLQGDVDPVDGFVDSLTGRGGWMVPASRAAIKTMVQRLYTAGIPRNTIVTQMPQVYQAIAVEVRAEDSAPPST